LASASIRMVLFEKFRFGVSPLEPMPVCEVPASWSIRLPVTVTEPAPRLMPESTCRMRTRVTVSPCAVWLMPYWVGVAGSPEISLSRTVRLAPYCMMPK
jgi:hypothetical protein